MPRTNHSAEITDAYPNARRTWSCFIDAAPQVDWFPAVQSDYTREGCWKGIDAMRGFPDFTENDAHWEKFLGYAAQLAGQNAPFLRALVNSGADRLSRISPFLGRAAGAAGNAVISVAQRYGRGRKRK